MEDIKIPSLRYCKSDWTTLIYFLSCSQKLKRTWIYEQQELEMSKKNDINTYYVSFLMLYVHQTAIITIW